MEVGVMAMEFHKRNVFENWILGGDHCWYCAKYIPFHSPERTMDHFWPRSRKGQLRVACCRDCNVLKKAMLPHQFLAMLKRKKQYEPENAAKYSRMITATKSLWELVKWSVPERYAKK